MSFAGARLPLLAIVLAPLLVPRLSHADAPAERNVGRVDGTVTFKHTYGEPESAEHAVTTVTVRGTWRLPPYPGSNRCLDGPSGDGWLTYIGLEGSLHYEKEVTRKIDLSQYDLEEPNHRETLKQHVAHDVTKATIPVRIPFEAHLRGVWVAENRAILGCLHVHPKKRKLMFTSSRFDTANNTLDPDEYSRDMTNALEESMKVVKRPQSFSSGKPFGDDWDPATHTAADTLIPKVDKETARYMAENGEREEITYSFTFFEQTPELIVSISRWEDWVPRAPAELGQPGNKLYVTAELRTASGGTYSAGAQRIVFQLEDVSNEPGLSLNYPHGSADGPDLELLEEENRDLEVTGRLRAVTRKQNISKARARVTAFDGGAYGTLVVTALMHDGRKIAGKLEDDPNRTRIPIPKRAEGSKIAEAWLKEKFGEQVPRNDGADDEALPEGDGDEGDGLTLYEEYRGIHTGDATRPWERLNPLRKDLVVENRVGPVAAKGLELFAKATELQVWSVATGYLPESRVVNLNRSGGAEQHGLRIDWDDDGLLAKEGPDTVAAAFRDGKIASGNIESPKDCDVLLVSRAYAPPPESAKQTKQAAPRKKYQSCEQDPEWQRETFAADLAHELGHGVGLRHHGVPSDRVGKAFTAYSGAYDRDGSPITSVYYRAPKPFPGDTAVKCKGGKRGEKCWESKLPRGAIGLRQGDSAGDLGCLMAYRHAYAWMWDVRTDSLHEVPTCLMPQASKLCTSTAGTFLNEPGKKTIPHAPDGWFGDAAMGPCARKLRLKAR